MPPGRGRTDGVQLVPPASEASAPTGSRILSQEIGGLRYGCRKRGNGIALLGGIPIHKQENKENIFWLLLSLVVTYFSEAVWVMWKH